MNSSGGRRAAAAGPARPRGGPGRRPVRAVRDGVRARLRSPGRPRLWFEVLLIGVGYWLYSLVRNGVPEHKGAALRHSEQIWDAERALGLAVERSVNQTVDGIDWLIVGMNYYYATLHFVVTIGVLVWLFLRHPGRYAAARLVLLATTGLALVGYHLYPLAPPRLVPGGGFTDTVLVHDTWGSMASGDLASVSNQYAAMPSMHIGWSAWCALAVVMLARRRWVRVLGALYPAATLVVIVSTANHFWLDAVGGLVCLGAGSLAAYAVHGRWPHRFPRTPAPRPSPAAPGADPRDGGGPADGAAPARPAVPRPAPAPGAPGEARGAVAQRRT